MNLADYLSELLRQHDEVSVPGLGYFVRERINGYYNEQQAKFYPPRHQVRFVAELRDDDTFAQYVADKKNISLASSKYFAEKFISKLREQAVLGKYAFADLGFFQVDNNQQLFFKPFDKIATDPDFYGYPAINIHTSGHPGYSNPVSTEPVKSSSVTSVPPAVIAAQAIRQQQYFEEEPEIKKRPGIWLIILIAIGVLALAVFGIYKFFPAEFDKLRKQFRNESNETVKPDTAVHVYRHEANADTVKKALSVATDTTIKTTAPAAGTAGVPEDTVEQSRFEIVVASFTRRQVARANAEVTRLKALGLDARIATDIPGPRLKVSVGTLPTYAAAHAKLLALVKAGKINKDSQLLEIKL
jgi:hypothetical protein